MRAFLQRRRSVTQIDREIRQSMRTLMRASGESREQTLARISMLKQERFDAVQPRTFDRMLTGLR